MGVRRINVDDRERLLLLLAAQGEPDYLIAYEIGVSDAAAVSHLFGRLCEKLGAANRMNAVVIAVLRIFTKEEKAALRRLPPPLSTDIRVLGLLAAGKSIDETAQEMGCSPSTIDGVIRRLKARLNARSIRGAIRAARNRNYL